MMNSIQRFCVAGSVLAFACLFTGCDREVSRTSSSSTSSDGSAKTKENVVKQAPDGTVTKEETSRTRDSDGEGSTKTKTTVKSPDGSVTKQETKTTTPAQTP